MINLTTRLVKILLILLMPVIVRGQERKLIIRQGHRDMVNMVKYSPGGDYVFSAGEDGVIKMWDIKNGVDVKTFTGHDAGVKCIEITPDGTQMLSGDGAGDVIVWNIAGDPVPVKQISAHTDAVNIIKLLPDQSGFLTGSSDKLIKHWSSVDYALIKTIEGMTGQVKSFGISPDGTRMVMGAQRSNDVELLLIDIEKGVILDDALKHVKGAGAAKAYTAVLLTPLAVATSIGKGDIDKEMLTYYTFDYSNIEFTSDGKSVLISQNLILPMMASKKEEDKTGGTTISVVELNADRSQFMNVKKPKRFSIDYARSKALFNEDQTKIIVNSKLSIMIYDMVNADFPESSKESATYEPPILQKFTRDISWLTSIAMSPDYRTVISSSEDRSLDLWDITSGRRIRTLEGYVQPALAVEPMPDGKHIAVGSKNKNLTIWDITNGRLVRTFDRSYDVTHIDISTDGKYMVTTSLNTRFFKLWNIRTGNILGTYMEKNDDIVWVKFDNDPDYILAVTENGELKKWSKSEKKIKKKLKEDYHMYDDRNMFGSRKLIIENRQIDVSENGKNLITDLQRGIITDAVFSIDGDMVFTTNDMGETIIYNLITGEMVVSMAIIDDFDFITYTPDYYYTSSKGASKALAFRENEKILPFAQMEIRLNRPDIVVERLGYASEKLIASYRSAYLKRLKRLGYAEEDITGIMTLPVVEINDSNYPLATQSKQLSYEVKASDYEANLDRINVFINEVPVFGYNGIDISDGNNSITKSIEVSLSSGLNVIRTVVVNENGMESIPHVMEINYEAPYKKPDLYLVSIGVSRYQNENYNLSFAAKDARDISDFFAKSDVFYEIHSKVLTDDQATSANISQMNSFLSQADIDDVVIIFIAGHGVLDNTYTYYFGTYDMDFLNPSNGGMPYDDLEELIMNLPCRNKLLFMDTCHSGELDADEVETVKSSVKKSGRVAFRSAGGIIQYKENAFGLENTLELSKNLFGDLRNGTGATVIAAAGGTEFALEGLNSENGLFTSSMIEGIRTRRADLNRDRMYTVSEFRKYISERVVHLSGGKQVPTSREENLKHDFRIY